MRDLEKEVKDKRKELEALELLWKKETENFNKMKPCLTSIVEDKAWSYSLLNVKYLKDLSAYEFIALLGSEDLLILEKSVLKFAFLLWAGDSANAKKTIKVDNERMSVEWISKEIENETEFGKNILTNFHKVIQDAEVV